MVTVDLTRPERGNPVKLPKYQQVAAMVRDQVADGTLAARP
jgi:hypothetical protein